MRALDELATALAKFQAEAPVVAKGKTAKIETQGGRSYSYSYADLADVSVAVMPILAKHGLAFTALPRAGILTGMLVHTSGQRLTGEWPITGRTPQEIGSSLTYGRRYLLGCLTGVVTDDDDDGQLAERHAKRTRKAPGGGPEVSVPPVAPPAPIQRRPRPRAAPAPEEPPTGLPGPGPEAQSKPADEEPPAGQRTAMFAAMGAVLGNTGDREERLALVSAIVGRRVESSKELNASEVRRVLSWLEDCRAGRVAWVYSPDEGAAYVTALEEPPL